MLKFDWELQWEYNNDDLNPYYESENVDGLTAFIIPLEDRDDFDRFFTNNEWIPKWHIGIYDEFGHELEICSHCDYLEDAKELGEDMLVFEYDNRNNRYSGYKKANLTPEQIETDFLYITFGGEMPDYYNQEQKDILYEYEQEFLDIDIDDEGPTFEQDKELDDIVDKVIKEVMRLEKNAKRDKKAEWGDDEFDKIYAEHLNKKRNIAVMNIENIISELQEFLDEFANMEISENEYWQENQYKIEKKFNEFIDISDKIHEVRNDTSLSALDLLV